MRFAKHIAIPCSNLGAGLSSAASQSEEPWSAIILSVSYLRHCSGLKSVRQINGTVMPSLCKAVETAMSNLLEHATASHA